MFVSDYILFLNSYFEAIQCNTKYVKNLYIALIF